MSGYGGSGASSGPYGAGGGGYGSAPGSYGFGTSRGGPTHLPGGVNGPNKGWGSAKWIALGVVGAILIGAGISFGVWQRNGSALSNATVSCEAKPANDPAANGRDCKDYGWDGVSPLEVSITLSGVSGGDWSSDCAGFFANADGSEEDMADQPDVTSAGLIFTRTVGPDDIIAGDSQFMAQCRIPVFHLSHLAKFKFAIGRA